MSAAKQDYVPLKNKLAIVSHVIESDEVEPNLKC